MSTQISKEEAAVISAALLAYLGKPPLTEKISTEEIQQMFTNLSKELKEVLLKELEEKFRNIEKRISRIEMKLDSLGRKIEELKMETSRQKIFGETKRPAWGLASRHVLGFQREVAVNVSKSTSIWASIGKVEKQQTFLQNRGRKTFYEE
ncbi:hypothetical protein DRO26_01715 [Candidatus Bathyarchaeota archaeon]|nr:MAG: hypothetical protein DRO26_01715 [Candidatus Bathyarchaeota archaeon]